MHHLSSAMNSHPHVAPEAAVATAASDSQHVQTACPIIATVKARAKALKKWRKHERLRQFMSWCASFHALGFSF